MYKKIFLGAAIVLNSSVMISSAQEKYEFKEKDGKFYVREDAHDSIESALDQFEKAFFLADPRNNNNLEE